MDESRFLFSFERLRGLDRGESFLDVSFFLSTRGLGLLERCRLDSPILLSLEESLDDLVLRSGLGERFFFLSLSPERESLLKSLFFLLSSRSFERSLLSDLRFLAASESLSLLESRLLSLRPLSRRRSGSSLSLLRSFCSLISSFSLTSFLGAGSWSRYELEISRCLKAAA